MKTQIMRILLAALLIGPAGCQWIDQPSPLMQDPVSVTPEPPGQVQPGSRSMENRFTEGPTDSADAVQTAIMWSEKYERLSETSNELRDRNAKLFEENTELKKKVSDLSRQLTQTQKELTEANDFLQKMHLELNQWKSDVLGFREEQRKAQAAQLQALAKILRILGAEPIEAEPAASAPQQAQVP